MAATNAPSPNRKRLVAWVAAIAVTLAVIWGGIALAFSSGQDGADSKQSVPAPADTLKDSSQTDQLGN